MTWWRNIFGRAAPAPHDELAAALARLYGQQQPFHLGATIAFADGGPDPLDAVSIYWNERGPHWHYVSSGLAPVMNAELTFRLAAKPSDVGSEPARFLGSIAYNAPTWPVAMLNMLARRVHRTKRPFALGHWWEGAPGVLQPDTDLRRLAFARDPELGQVGRVLFLQAVGISAELVESMKADELARRGDATLDQLATTNPLLVTR